ncbi:MAG: RNA polymerase sigma factor [Candidatus Doudnabacteria bacterium]
MLNRKDLTDSIPQNKLLALLTQAQAGKEEALADLYEAYYLKIYRFIFYRVSHKETAEDLTEDTFVKAFASIKRLKDNQAFEGWLYRIARNLVIDYYRAKKQLVPLDSLENTLEYDTNLVELINLKVEQTLLIKLLDELTEEQQTVIKMKFVEDLDNSTIAAALNKSEGSIRVISHRAIAKLKDIFKQNFKPNTKD